MAKIRIYELARDLNMTNKALLDKLRELDIQVKSHMSSIDTDDINRIKAVIFGVQKEQIEETRVKSTIIRRRKKVVPFESAVTEKAAESEEEPVEEETPETKAVVEPEKEALSEAEIVPEEKKSKPTASRKTKLEKDKAAKIIKRPEPESEPESEPVEPTRMVDEKETLPVADENEAPVDLEKEKKERTPPIPIKPVKKKKKKDTPAKIIKMPIPGAIEIKPDQRKIKGTKSPHRVKKTIDIKPPSEEVSGSEKKKKLVKKGRPVEQDKKFFKKKISFKRKEVVEGSALYGGGKRARKGRKAARGKKAPVGQKTQITMAKAIKRRIKVDDTIILSELAKRMGFKANELIVKLMGLGVMATVNQTIDFDTAVLVAAEFEYEVEKAAFKEEAIIKVETDDPDKLIERPPVVTVMGHVDHGKTSLLDVIRKTNVTKNEAGGITQHIGAYNVATNKGRIVFLDTPGHEAFTAMRSRGAGITDLVVLVVAADDGVMPQTIEAINHAKAADVPIIVAINKIDKPNAEPDRVQRQLAEIGLTPEDWGGDTIFIKVSAKREQGIDELLEMILLQAELLELKANPHKHAFGHVVEAKLDAGRGPVATVLIQEGTLKNGEPVVCGVHYGKIRSLVNDMGQQVDLSGPSMPVEIIGLSGVPMAGDEFIALADEKDAKQISQYRVQNQRSKELAKTSRLSLEKLFEKMSQGEVKDLNIIIKADVHGSIEALRDSLTKLSNEEVNINVVHSATGAITETDVSLATVSDAIIIGFNVRPSPKVQAMANEENVDMRFYNVIYNVIKEVKNAIIGMMASTFEEHIIGHAEVRQVFMVPKIGAIAGCHVTDGKVQRGKLIRLVRDGIVIYQGKIASLRRFKDDAKEVMSGYECGIGIENYNDVKMDDVIECYYLEELRPEIE